MLYESIRTHLNHGVPVNTAMRHAIEETIAVANIRLRHDEPLDQVLDDLCLTDIPNIRAHLHPTAVTQPWSLGGPLQIVMPGKDIQGIPSPSCIQRYLPKDRQPTADDIRRAWQQCTA